MPRLKVTPTDLPGVLIVEPARFGDDRGFFSETWNRRLLAEHGIDCDFVQDNQSLSARVGTVRGLHYQLPPHAQDKLVRVVAGAILDVAVDIRRSSPTFGRHVAVELSAENWRQLFVPRGFAHGFATLQPDTQVCYKVSGYWSGEAERGIRFDDPRLGIDWRIGAADAILSERDREYPVLSDQPDLFE